MNSWWFVGDLQRNTNMFGAAQQSQIMFVMCSISPTLHQPSWWFVGYHNKISNNSPTKELHTLTDGLVIFGMAATPSSSCERTQTRNLLGVKGSEKTTYDWIPIIYAPPTHERNWLRHRGGCERTCIRNYSRNTPGTLPGHSRDTSGTLPGVASAQTKKQYVCGNLKMLFG